MAAVAAAALTLAACTSSGGSSPGTGTGTAGGTGTTTAPAAGAAGGTGTGAAAGTGTAAATATGRLVVFAATSLTDVFNRIAGEFEKANPGVHVTFNYDGSSTLATQINQGAPADVFASAAPSNMKTVTDAGNAAGTPDIFTRNTAEILVENGNPHHIMGIRDLGNSGIKVVVCAPEVPCGQVATEIFRKAGVTVRPVSQETNVGGVITKITLGEADAGIVYVTDAKENASKADGVPIPAAQNAITDYPIVTLKDAPNPTAAAAFIRFVRGPQGQQALASFGFIPPQ